MKPVSSTLEPLSIANQWVSITTLPDNSLQAENAWATPVRQQFFTNLKESTNARFNLRERTPRANRRLQDEHRDLSLDEETPLSSAWFRVASELELLFSRAHNFSLDK